MIALQLRLRPTPKRSLCRLLFSRSQLRYDTQSSRLRAMNLAPTAMAEQQDYLQWSHSQLRERIGMLERRLGDLEQQLFKVPSTSKLSEDSQPIHRHKYSRSERDFDPSKYSSRLIAFKFAYLGQNYNGYEYHANNATPLPTIEETLWKALMKARLIFPIPNPAIVEGEPNFEGCEYSKCGRTDKGVSAFGQVIGVRVRSNRPLSRVPTPLGAQTNEAFSEDGGIDKQLELAAQPLGEVETGYDLPTPTSIMSLDEETLSFHPIYDEIPYCQILNRLLPPDIRILAWCPAPPLDFSARFSCRERRYTYFFTQPAFSPNPSPATPFHDNERSQGCKTREGYLDIPLMQAAAKKFEGLHDFRNFCKIDASKQIAIFERRIFHADVVEQLQRVSDLPAAAFTAGLGFQQHEGSDDSIIEGGLEDGAAMTREPRLYAVTVHGSAFLWHQVRHMVAILFLVGQGLEPPSLVDDLLDIAKTPRKPQYEMADDAPLVLWDCVFPREGGTIDPRTGRGQDAMEWVYVGDDGGREPNLVTKRAGKTDGKYGFGGVVDDLWKVWRGKKMDEVLAGTLLNVVVRQGTRQSILEGDMDEDRLDEMGTGRRGGKSQKVFQGGDGPKYAGKYIPVMQKPRMESVEVINGRYRERKGFEVREEVKEMGMRSLVLEREKQDED